MNNEIIDIILSYWKSHSKTRVTTGGWVSGNAVCCGDTRQRGGIIVDNDVISYSCFNCNFMASWQVGRIISGNMRKLMQNLGIPESEISQICIGAIRLLNSPAEIEYKHIIHDIKPVELPSGAKPILELIDNCPEKLIPVMEYLAERKLYLEDYPFYWTPYIGYSNRLIIPFFYKNQIVGYTARSINNTTPKYISSQQPSYVFNIDKQRDDRVFSIICEGPIDAISIDGCAIMGSEIKEGQQHLLNHLHKEIILVPDRDKSGMALIEQAIEYGYSVSMPKWPTDIKDINDAVKKLGRLATLWLIVTSKETSPLKIRVKAKMWINHN